MTVSDPSSCSAWSAVGPEHVGEPGGLGAADEHRAGAVGPGSELGHRALADQPAGADDHHAVDGLLHLGEQVAGDEHRAALVVGQVPEEPAQPLDALGVQAVGRLVEHEDGGVAEQCRREREPLAHAEGVAARPAVAGVGEPDLDERLVGAAQRQARGAAVHAQVVAAGPGGVEGGLQDGADGPERLGQRRVRGAVERGRARVGRLQAEHHPQGRGLAGAVGPEEAGDRARLHGEAQVADRPHLAEGLAESADVDPHGSHRRGAAAGNGAAPDHRRRDAVIQPYLGDTYGGAVPTRR